MVDRGATPNFRRQDYGFVSFSPDRRHAIMPHEIISSFKGTEMVKMVGNSGQLSLGKKYAGQYYELQHLPDGAIVLRPMKVVPASEAWVHEPEVQYQLKGAKEWLKKTPRSETSVDALLRKRRKAK